MTAPWTRDEVAWARECFHAGDSFEEIAEGAGRTVAEVKAVLGTGANITPREREILSLYTAGVELEAIADELGMSGVNRRKGPATAITNLRRKGIRVPHRIQAARNLTVGARA